MGPKTAAPPKAKKYWQVLLKLGITALCLWYVSGKIDFQKTGLALSSAKWVFLFPALLLFILSKFISAIRLNIYFRDINIHLPLAQSTKLYWLGMFYNLFLPGSISGDAYKVFLLTKKYSIPYKKTTAAVLLDRISGLLGLGLILSLYSLVVLKDQLFQWLLIPGAIIAVIGLLLIVKKFFPDFKNSFWKTLLLGIAVQAVQVACIYCIMAGVGIPVTEHAYLFLFLVSSIVSVLPLTIGGLGIREVVFLEGSAKLGLLQENAVLVSLLFYIITMITSLAGVYYVFRDPLKK